MKRRIYQECNKEQTESDLKHSNTRLCTSNMQVHTSSSDNPEIGTILPLITITGIIPCNYCYSVNVTSRAHISYTIYIYVHQSIYIADQIQWYSSALNA